MYIKAYGRSDIGRERSNNEDNLKILCPPHPPVGLFVVADGVGGNKHGEVASRLFVEGVEQRIRAAADSFARYRIESDREMRDDLLHMLEQIVDQTGLAIYRATQDNPDLEGMATTGVVIVMVEQGVFIAHAGDSRAYLLRGDQTYQLTEDHTLANRFLKDGLINQEDLTHFPFTNVLTRSFGGSPHVDIDTLFVQTEPGDRFVLCSDGLHNYVEGEELLPFSKGCGDGRELVEVLIKEANERGGEDNITVAVVEVTDQQEAAANPDRVDLETRLRFLQKLFLFQTFTEQELLRVMRIIYTERHARGAVIIQEGAPGNELYVVVDGSVDVTLEGEYLTTIGAGGHFGELALLDNHPRSASILARTDVTLLTIVRDDFNRLVREEHALAVKLLWCFLQNVAGRMRELSVEVKDLNKELSNFKTRFRG